MTHCKNKYKNGDTVGFDLRTIFPDATIYGQYFEDDNGNAEIYISATEQHTSFNINLPKSLDK